LPTTVLKSIKILLTIATYYDYEIWQMDVKIIILNENLQEKVHVTLLESFLNPWNLSIKYASYKNSFMNLSKLRGVVISILMR
jgi:hypothetical protein